MSACPGSVLAALVDGELDHAAREKAQRHLAHCDACRAEVEGQRRLKASLSRLDPPLPSSALLARLAGLSSVPPVGPVDAGPQPPGAPAPVVPRPSPLLQPAAALGARTVRTAGVREPAPAPWTPSAGLPGPRSPWVAGTSTRPSSSRSALRPAVLRSRGLAPRHRAAAGSAFAVLGVAAALALAPPAQRPASTPVVPAQGAFVADVTGTGSARSGATLGAVLTSVSAVRPVSAPGSRPAVPVRTAATSGLRTTR